MAKVVNANTAFTTFGLYRSSFQQLQEMKNKSEGEHKVVLTIKRT
jgi:hypothetical protein